MSNKTGHVIAGKTHHLWPCSIAAVDEGNPAPVGNYEVPMKHCKYWDYNGIKDLVIGAGFLPSTEYTYGPLPLRSTYNPIYIYIYRMYNRVYSIMIPEK